MTVHIGQLNLKNLPFPSNLNLKTVFCDVLESLLTITSTKKYKNKRFIYAQILGACLDKCPFIIIVLLTGYLPGPHH